MKFRTTILLLIVTAFLLTACQQGVIKTKEGIPRKLVIRQDGTKIYDSQSLDNIVGEASQWDIFYIFGERGNTYLVSRDVNTVPEKSIYLRKEDVFDWNTYLCLTYLGSPQLNNRPPLRTFRTLEDALRGDGAGGLIEKQEHRTDFQPQDCHPILVEYQDSIYYIAALYDDVDEQGNYSFEGHYAFGYTKYTPGAHQFRRYVSKAQLESQLKMVLGLTDKTSANMKPSELDQIYGEMSTLLTDFGTDSDNGFQDVMSMFAGSDVPDAAAGPIFSPEAAQHLDQLDPVINKMASRMSDYLQNPYNWNESGYSFIPAEWMDTP